MKVQIDLHNASGLQPVLLIGTIRKLFVQLPPIGEQTKIAAYLYDTESRFKSTAMLLVKHIERMREIRTRLIADVVTGKLDVREAAAQLPDEIDELEPLDEAETETDVEDAADEADAAFEEAEA